VRAEAQRVDDEDRADRDAFIAELVAARKAAGLSQAEVARRMGVAPPAVSKLERGRRSPTLITVQQYARAVGAKLCLQVCDSEPAEPAELVEGVNT
jgi:transcriptional regulator with XRE-family HTH domain